MDEDIIDSQPVETETVTSESDTPSNLEVTEELEPGAEGKTAETKENAEAEERKYAGKYNSVEELEKGYGSQTSYINELQTKIDEYKSQLEKQQQLEQSAKLEEAKAKGFDSIESQEIAQKIIVKEFEIYANNLSKVAPEHYETAREALNNYYSTGNEIYLNHAKELFPNDFIENVAVEKLNYKLSLQNELKQRKMQQHIQQTEQLCSDIENNFKDFLSDILVDDPQKLNSAKSAAMSTMFNLGVIKNLDDMKTFEKLYNSITERAVNDYITAMQAQNNVDTIKKKSQVPSGTSSIPDKKPDINTKEYWDNFYNK